MTWRILSHSTHPWYYAFHHYILSHSTHPWYYAFHHYKCAFCHCIWPIYCCVHVSLCQAVSRSFFCPCVSPSVRLSLCLSVSPHASVCLSVSLFVCLTSCLCLSVCLSVCLSHLMPLSVCLSLCLSVSPHASVRPSVSLFVCLTSCLCLSVGRLSVHQSLSPLSVHPSEALSYIVSRLSVWWVLSLLSHSSLSRISASLQNADRISHICRWRSPISGDLVILMLPHQWSQIDRRQWVLLLQCWVLSTAESRDSGDAECLTYVLSLSYYMFAIVSKDFPADLTVLLDIWSICDVLNITLWLM